MSAERDDEPSYLIIDLKNKPFGAVLPVEIQNRIMWMSMKMVHADSYGKVMQELSELPVCQLGDWISVANNSSNFFNTYSVCVECDSTDCIHTEGDQYCHWCRLYTHDKVSLYQLEVSRKLNRERDAIGCYDDARYRQFVKTNRQRYADCLKYSFMVCRLPMLCHVPAREMQSNFSYIHEECTFEEIYIGVQLVLEEFAYVNGLFEYDNPRLVREKAYQSLRRVREMTAGDMWRDPPTLEEVRDVHDDILERVQDEVDLFLNNLDT